MDNNLGNGELSMKMGIKYITYTNHTELELYVMMEQRALQLDEELVHGTEVLKNGSIKVSNRR